jgi:hypothetical protein
MRSSTLLALGQGEEAEVLASKWFSLLSFLEWVLQPYQAEVI